MAKHVCWHKNPYFLQDDHYTGITQWVNEGNANLVLEDGEYILKAGTIWPTNNTGAIGIVLRDVVVPAGSGGVTFTLLTHAHINPDYLPAAPTANALSSLPKTIVFSNPGDDNASVPAGYFAIKNKSAAASVSAGAFAAGATVTSSVVVNAISPFSFNNTQDILDWQISDYNYPVYVSSVVESTGDCTVTIKARNGFHCHAGEELTLRVMPGAFASADYPSNIITVVKFV